MYHNASHLMPPADVCSAQNPSAVPPTELESFNNRLCGASKFMDEINGRLANIVIKLRGALGPKGETAAVPTPCGLMGEMNGTLGDILHQQQMTVEMIQMLEAVI